MCNFWNILRGGKLLFKIIKLVSLFSMIARIPAKFQDNLPSLDLLESSFISSIVEGRREKINMKWRLLFCIKRKKISAYWNVEPCYTVYLVFCDGLNAEVSLAKILASLLEFQVNFKAN